MLVPQDPRPGAVSYLAGRSKAPDPCRDAPSPGPQANPEAWPMTTAQAQERPGAEPSSEPRSPASRRPHRIGAWTVAGNLGVSFRYAAQGLSYAFSSQRNFRIHVGTGFVVFGLGLWLGLSADRLAVLVLTVAAVLVLELLNTATEAVVDLAIGRRFHPLARIAKDCAAAAVLVASLSSLLIALLLLIPPLATRLGL